MSTPAVRAVVAMSLLASILEAQDASPPACDHYAIQWVLPGDFPQALARARQEQRMLVIKGISFGVDTEGARCATKGVW